jgi:cytosine/adenosine deaminase-related metal-dependent hydrolase
MFATAIDRRYRSHMIVRARVLITMDGPPIENGAVAISGNRVVDVGTFPEISARQPSRKIVDLGERALLPGLINAHCHLDYTCLRGRIRPQKSFADWIRAINSAKAHLSSEDYIASIKEGFAEASRFGTTTIVNLCASPELVAQIDEPIRTWWFGELIDVRSSLRANEIVDLAIRSLKSKENWGLAPHALFTASPNLFRHCEEIARRGNILLTTHLAESHEEFSMFREASGPLYKFMKEIGRDMNDCGHKTPVALFLEDSSDLPNWIITHLNHLAESDFDLLATPREVAGRESTTKFAIVHCPRSHKYFGHFPFPFEKFRERGFNICLGTDSLASNVDLNLFAEMRQFQETFPKISPAEIFSMATVNPARALRQETRLGKIRFGFYAELISVPCTTSSSAFEEIIAFDQPVDWLMIDGKARSR